LEKENHRQASSINKQVNNLLYPLDGTLFDHEKLDVYWLELGFVAWLAAFWMMMTPVARQSSAPPDDASVAKGLVSIDRVRSGKEMLARVVAMLTRLIDRFDTNSRTS
jgi:hypothetical protein